MALQPEDNLFEIKVPIFCEWTFDKDLPNNYSADSSMYNYIFGLIGDEGDSLKSTQYLLPGFPGIKYCLDIYMDDGLLDLDFDVDMDYKKYNFDADFVCTITDCEPKHFVHTFNDATDMDPYTFFNLHDCIVDCVGCPMCLNQKVVIRVEGTFTVKFVDELLLSIEPSDETLKFWTAEEKETKDFVIAAEEQEIRVHKEILAQNSAVFERMLDSERWKETMENKIVIPDFSHKIIKYAVDALYNEDVILKEKEECLLLYQFADKYDMEKLTKALKIAITFTPHNVIEYANFFFQSNAGELVNCCIDYILSCSQYSLPIKDIEILDAQIYGLFVSQVLVSPVLKRNPQQEHRNFNNEKEGDKSW